MRALRVVLYARVSKEGDQDPEVQLQKLRPWCAARGWAIVAEEADRVTGDPNRRKGDPPGLRRALQVLAERQAEVLVVFAADRLVRSPVGLLQLLARIEAFGGKVASYQDGADLDTTTDVGELLAFIRGWYARMEMRLIRARTLAGLERARAQGKRLGCPPKEVDVAAVERLKREGLGWRRIGAQLGLCHMTVKRAYRRSQREVG